MPTIIAVRTYPFYEVKEVPIARCRNPDAMVARLKLQFETVFIVGDKR